jgi:alpha 1,2-mannosyltransferase
MPKVRPSVVLILILVILLAAVNVFIIKKTSNSSSTKCPKCPEPQSLEFRMEKNPISDFQPIKKKAKAAIVILARNSDLEGLNKTIPQFESTFNHKFQYPYVFLNDVPFNENFKQNVKKLSKSEMKFGTIPHEHWSYPSWINQTRAAEVRMDMKKRNVIYGDSLP